MECVSQAGTGSTDRIKANEMGMANIIARGSVVLASVESMTKARLGSKTDFQLLVQGRCWNEGFLVSHLLS
jgi:hypothetical protein